MTSEFSVDLDHLDEIVSRLSGLAGFIADGLDEIEKRVVALLENGWEGAASSAYSEAHQQWIVGAREFAEGLQQMVDAARSAHTGYSSAAEANLRMLQGG